MLCPRHPTFAPIPKPQGKFIGHSKEGLAFADQDFGGKLENSGANAKPLPKIIAINRHLFLPKNQLRYCLVKECNEISNLPRQTN